MDLQNKKVVQSNTLIKAIAKMDALPLKLFELAVANVDTKEKDPEVELEKDLIRTFLPRTNALRHDYLQTIMTNLMDKSTFTVKYTKENGKKKTEIFAPFSKIEFSEDESTVKLSFSNKIMPYITELKKNFTQYRIEDLRHFTSSNTITIYKVLMMYYNQYTNYIANGKRTKEELESFLNPVIDVSELKALTVQGKKSYDRFSDLKKRVIEPAIKEINEHTEFNITYDTIRVGRKIAKIQFHISNNSTEKLIGELTAEKKLSLSDVQNSPYTALLLGAMIVNFADANNESLMMSLGENVYPKYDVFVNKHSLDDLQKHLKYVKDHMNSKLNELDKYLIKALDDFEKNKGKYAKRDKSKLKQKEKLPDWAKDDTAQKNILTEKGIQRSKEIDELLEKINKDTSD